MLLTKKIKIILNRGNIPYFKKHEEFKKYKIGDEVDIDIKYIPKTYKYIVEVQCDICEVKREIQYSTYWDSTKHETEIYTCKGCSNIKREKTNMKLYGVKNCFQDIDKIKNSMMLKYGVNHNMQLKKCLENRKQTYIKNWGVDNPSKNINIFEKALKSGRKIQKYKNTNLFYQGTYELEFLEKYYDKIEIRNGLSIKYENKIYHSDFYLPEMDMVIEIKSTYWYNKHKSINVSKTKYSKKYHNFLMILDKNYEDFEELLRTRTTNQH